MAISALVDRARVVSKASTGARTEGTTRTVDVTGGWFRARLTLPGAEEDVEASRSRVRTVARPELLYAVNDGSGAAVALTNEQRLEVDSHELGLAIWEITGDPEPIRKKRRVIGHVAQLARVIEHQAAL